MAAVSHDYAHSCSRSLCNREQCAVTVPGTLIAMESDRTEPAERLARSERLIEEYRVVKQRRLLKRAVRLWRDTEARQRFVELEASPQRVH
jgi:hypothetical protein